MGHSLRRLLVEQLSVLREADRYLEAGPAEGLKQAFECMSSSPDMSMWVASPMLLVPRMSSKDPCRL